MPSLVAQRGDSRVIAATGRPGTVSVMTTPPRTVTRSARPAKDRRRDVDVDVRLLSHDDATALVAPAELSVIWDEMAALASRNPALAAIAERARDLASTGQLADNSLRSYQSQWRCFTDWCEKVGLTSLPASPATVLLYVAHRVDQKRTAGTISVSIAAIRSYHLRAGYTNPTDHAAVSRARAAVARSSAVAGSTVVKAHPISLDELRSMVDCLPDLNFRKKQMAELLRIRLKAVGLVTWFTGRRLDEMARAQITWLVLRGDVQYLESDHQKMKRDGFATPIEKIADTSICPRSALDDWLRVSAPFRGDVQQLFALPVLEESGEIRLVDTISAALQKRRATRRCDGNPEGVSPDLFEAKQRSDALEAAIARLRYDVVRWMKLAGVEPRSNDRTLRGHGMRRGVVTELRANGADPRAVADRVGFASLDLVERYSDAAQGTNALDVLGL